MVYLRTVMAVAVAALAATLIHAPAPASASAKPSRPNVAARHSVPVKEDPQAQAAAGPEEAMAWRGAPEVRWPSTKDPGGNGLKLSVDRAQDIDIDYSGFRHAFGGDWVSRLRLVRLPEGTEIASINDTKAGRLKASVAAGSFAVTAGPGGSAGSFRPTALAPSDSWQVGPQSGDFEWSYPLAVPDLPGVEPKLELSYTSGTVDGRTASTNNQPSAVGEGFDLPIPFIERSYQSCKEDGRTDENLCWAFPNATVSMPGFSGDLVLDDVTKKWHSESDIGWRIEFLSGATNGDNDGEFWKLTSPDGTQYFFGRTTDSAWTVPVYGDDANEPCQNVQWCRQAWRWQLDYVVDAHGDAARYVYVPEANYYSRSGAVTQYVRGGQIARIEYGFKDGSTVPAAGRVLFTTAERCIPGTTCAQSQPQNYPDTPLDLACGASSCAIMSPTFWTTRRLAQVSTQVYSGGDYRDVGSWTFNHTFPATGDASSPSLWLDSIVHSGLAGGTVSLPPVRFDGVQRENRLDATGGAPPMNKWRLQRITNETGGQTIVTYGLKECARTALPVPDSNSAKCFPAYWTLPGAGDPTPDWFNRYVVTQVSEVDGIGGSPPQVTQYEYVGGMAWHHDDQPLIPARFKTWGQARGFQKVRVRTGDPAAGPQTLTEHIFLRGMANDLKADGSRPNVVVVDSLGIQTTDKAVRRGFARETTVYNGPNWVSRTLSEPLEITKTATQTRPGGTIDAYQLDEREEREFTKLSDGTVRETSKSYQFDAYGRQILAEDRGDVSRSDDDACVKTSYVENLNAWILDTASRVESVSVLCAATVVYPSDLLSDVRHSYDGLAWGVAPTKGEATATEQAVSYSGGAPQYITVRRFGYDTHGRLTEQFDALGNRTSSAYTPASGGPVTSVTSTNAAGHATVDTLDPLTGENLSTVDANGRRTDRTYDALGRLTAVWIPGRDKASGQSANIRYAYQVRNNAPSVISESRLTDTGGYVGKHTLFDGFLRERQKQEPSPAGGRIISDTLYDSRGNVAKTNSPYWNDQPPATSLVTVADAAVPSQTRFVYDQADREIAEQLYAAGTFKWQTQTSYGGDRTAIDPPDGETATMTIVDARGRTTELRQFTGGAPTGAYDATTYTYTKGNEPQTVTDPAGNVWRYEYDLRGRKVSATDPDAGTTTYTYDDEDRQVEFTTARGRTVTTTYDALGRRTAVFEGATKLAEWRFDTLPGGRGMLTSATRFSGTNAYVTAITGYDAAGNKSGESLTIPAVEGGLSGTYTTTYTYNSVGQPATTTLPAAGGLGAETLTYTYDANGLAQSMTGWDTYLAEIAYDELGRVGLATLGAAGKQVWRSFGFDPATGRTVRSATDSESESTPSIADVGYAYDPAGNVSSIVDGADAQSFRYDHLRRLTQASATGGPAPYTQSYTYDKTGNRLTEMRGSTTRSYTYAGGHRVASVATTGGPTVTYTYDADGNTITRGGQALTWDAEGDLVANGSASYVNDAEGGRVIQRDPGGATLYLGAMQLRRGSTGMVSATRYYTLAGGDVAVRTSGGLYWTVADHHGTGEISIGAGDLSVARRYLDPFGQQRAGPSGTWPGDKGFVGGTDDPALGLVRLGARDYDPAIGRFLSLDPIVDPSDPQQLHGYAYANHNPVSFSDPDGLLAKKTATKATAAKNKAKAAASKAVKVVKKLIEKKLIAKRKTPGPPPPVIRLSDAALRILLKAAFGVNFKVKNGYVYMYHGTTPAGARNIRDHGIDFTVLNPLTDFGAGLYLTNSRKQAEKWAKRMNHGRPGAVVVYKVKVADLLQLSGKVFKGASEEWSSFVKYHRVGGSRHHFDYVAGPLARHIPQNLASHTGILEHSGWQLSIHTPAAKALFDRSLYAIIQPGLTEYPHGR